MKFRKLYWVTEQIGADGKSNVTGVYTSIPDLRTRGIKWCEGCDHTAAFRISLVQLDSAKKPLGTWEGPEFAGLEDGLRDYIATGEFDEPSILQLSADLRSFK